MNMERLVTMFILFGLANGKGFICTLFRIGIFYISYEQFMNYYPDSILNALIYGALPLIFFAPKILVMILQFTARKLQKRLETKEKLRKIIAKERFRLEYPD